MDPVAHVPRRGFATAIRSLLDRHRLRVPQQLQLRNGPWGSPATPSLLDTAAASLLSIPSAPQQALGWFAESPEPTKGSPRPWNSEPWQETKSSASKYAPGRFPKPKTRVPGPSNCSMPSASKRDGGDSPFAHNLLEDPSNGLDLGLRTGHGAGLRHQPHCEDAGQFPAWVGVEPQRLRQELTEALGRQLKVAVSDWHASGIQTTRFVGTAFPAQAGQIVHGLQPDPGTATRALSCAEPTISPVDWSASETGRNAKVTPARRNRMDSHRLWLGTEEGLLFRAPHGALGILCALRMS